MKNKINSAIFALIISASIISCKENKTAETVDTSITPVENNIPVGDNSQVSLDWAGAYSGKIPCADCEGIEKTVILNEDKTFSMSDNYLGKKEGKFETKGKFEWDNAGSVITLTDANNDKTMIKVGENQLILLDQEGKEITGELAEMYILTKK